MNRTKVPNFTESFNRSTMSAQNPGSAAAPSPVPVPLPVFIPPPTTLLAPLYHQTARPEPFPSPSAVPSRELSVVQHAPPPAPGSESGILGWFKQNYGKVLLCVLLLIVVTILLVRRMTFFKNRQKLKKEQEDEEEDSTDIKDDEWESFFSETSTLNQGKGSDAENHAPSPSPPHHPQPPPGYPNPQQHRPPPAYPHHELYGPSPAPPPGAQPYPFPAPHPLSFPVPRSSSPPPSSPVNSTSSGMTPLPPLPPQAPAPAPAQASGQRGNVQPRFAPPESINAAAFMPPSMMPESTRPVRELSSDATFTVNTEEIPITVNPEAQEESKKKSADAAGAPGPDV